MGAVCSGVEWHVVDRPALEPVRTGVALLAEARRLHPEHFAWRSQPYEFVADVPAIDLLTGSAAARIAIETGGDLEPLFAAWRKYCAEFAVARREYLLYEP
jgi:uncharacterized protein YbbC (DUF1343 family)